MSEPTPTPALTIQEQVQTIREDLTSAIPALARTLTESSYADVRFHAMRALAKLAENPTFCQEIASTALASVSRSIQNEIRSVEPTGSMGKYQSQIIEVALALYESLQRHTSVAPASPTAPTDSGPALVARPAANDVDDWEIES
ncbi:hypothetical protein M408DRAFT_147890 [Serendipita vermifera MAFF 305830]|uniref:Uncharacterized protein n=1 Tax=Serendipita vermifera MAFF 305830 TaxID=933852 RepID=A0A0C3AU46_SERVB|nr:hypothetical protein M408DRAFT_147890 [Serendipita vermifera MAFF 305830]